MRSETFTLCALTLNFFSSVFASSVLLPILPSLLEMIGFKEDELSFYATIIYTFYSVGFFITTPVAAFFASSQKRFLVIDSGVFMISLAFSCFMPNFVTYTLVMFMAGSLQAVNFVSGSSLMTMLYDWQQLGKIFGINFMGFSLGRLTGPIVGGLMGENVGIASPLYVCLSVSFIAWGCLLMVKQPQTVFRENVELVRLLKLGRLWVIGFASLLHATMELGMESVFSIHTLEHLGLGVTDTGYAWFAFSFTTAIMSPIAGKLTDIIPKHYVLVFGLLLSAITGPLVFYGTTVTNALIALVFYGMSVTFLQMPPLPLMLLVVDSNGIKGAAAKVSGMNQFFFGIGAVVGPLFIGFLNDAIGLVWASAILSIVMAVYSLIILLVFADIFCIYHVLWNI